MAPARCSGCGHPSRSESRYCAHCGLPHTGLESDPGSTVDDGVATVSPKRVWRLAPVVIVVVALGAWWLFGDTVRSGGNDDTLERSEAAVTSDGGDDRAADSVEIASDRPDPPPVEATLRDLTPEELPEREELVGLSGHHLFIAHTLGLLRIDTDTGSVREFERSQLPGSLLGRYRDRLLLIQDQSRVVAVPAERPESAETLVFDTGPNAISTARMIDDDRMVLVSWSPFARFDTGPQRLLIDMEEGRVLDDSAYEWRTDDVTWVPGGGLFEFKDGGYQHLADGVPTVASGHLVLVYTCDGPDDCDNRWIDRRTGAAVDRHVPDGDHWDLQALDPDARVLFVNYPSRHRYFDTEHGWPLPANIVRGSGGGYHDSPPEAVLGDGRILITPTVAGVVIYDLDRHDAYLLDVGQTLRGVTGIVAVPKPDRWESS